MSCLKQKQPANYVDQFIGTSGNRWILFPGPCLPFGMVKLSPDNTDDYAMDAGYEYKNNSICGFGHVPYMAMGYVPADDGPVSNTLEYAYDDWCVAQMAKSLGKTDDYKYFMRRPQNWRNVFDHSTGYIRPKYERGPWLEEFSPVKSAVGKEDNFGTRDYVEANAWQYTWFVPHDLKGLINLM